MQFPSRVVFKDPQGIARYAESCGWRGDIVRGLGRATDKSEFIVCEPSLNDELDLSVYNKVYLDSPMDIKSEWVTVVNPPVKPSLVMCIYEDGRLIDPPEGRVMINLNILMADGVSRPYDAKWVMAWRDDDNLCWDAEADAYHNEDVAFYIVVPDAQEVYNEVMNNGQRNNS